MSQATKELVKQAAEFHVTYPEILRMLAVSAGLGTILALSNFFIGRQIDPRIRGSSGDPEKRLKAIMSSANLLFFCVGLTGILVVLDNNLLRAFVIVSTIAIISFRIPVDQKGTNAALLFSLLIGVSCGLNEISFAGIMLGVYLFMTVVLALALRTFRRQNLIDEAISLPDEN